MVRLSPYISSPSCCRPAMSCARPRITAIKERKKALAGSVVKIAGRDVMLSKKIMISIVMVPLLWIFYAVLMMVLTDWTLSTKVRTIVKSTSQAKWGHNRVHVPGVVPHILPAV